MIKPLRDRGLTGATYAVGGALIVLSMIDFVATVWPITPTSIEWRYGSMGVLSGYLLTPILGLTILLWTAHSCGHSRSRRAIAVVASIVAIGILVGLAGFWLDVVQIRRETDPQMRSTFDIGAAKAAVKLFLAAAVNAWLGVAGWRGEAPGATTPAKPDIPIIQPSR